MGEISRLYSLIGRIKILLITDRILSILSVQKTPFAQRFYRNTDFTESGRRGRLPGYKNYVIAFFHLPLNEAKTFANKPSHAISNDRLPDFFTDGQSQPVFGQVVFKYIHDKVSVGQRFPFTVNQSELRVFLESIRTIPA